MILKNFPMQGNKNLRIEVSADKLSELDLRLINILGNLLAGGLETESIQIKNLYMGVLAELGEKMLYLLKNIKDRGF